MAIAWFYEEIEYSHDFIKNLYNGYLSSMAMID